MLPCRKHYYLHAICRMGLGLRALGSMGRGFRHRLIFPFTDVAAVHQIRLAIGVVHHQLAAG